jgi:hypothetical protein
MVKFIKKQEITSTDCPIVVSQLINFNPNNIIKRNSYSNLIIENSDEYNIPIELKKVGGNFPLKRYITKNIGGFKSADLLITNKVNVKNDPLFFEYQLKYDVSSFSLDSVVQIFKNNTVKVQESEFVVEYAYTDDGDPDLLYDRYINDGEDTRYANTLKWREDNNNNKVNRCRVLLPLSFSSIDDFYTIRYVKRVFNVDYTTHMELIQLKGLYSSPSNYTIGNNNITLTSGFSTTDNPDNINSIYVIRNPYSKIELGKDISMQHNGDYDQSTSSWNIKVNTGSFVRSEEELDKTTNYYKIKYGYDQNNKYQIFSYIKPDVLGFNIIKINEAPIHIDGYTYPNYNIQLFPKKDYDDHTLPSGSVGLSLSNEDVVSLGISSIDTFKGHILFNKSIEDIDNLHVTCYVDMEESIYIRNLELNPRLYNSQFKTMKNIGIAVRKYTHTSSTSVNFSPYYFDFDNPTKFYLGSTAPGSTADAPVDGALSWNPYTSNFTKDGEFLPIANITLNELSPNLIKLTDARVIAGGIDKNKLNLLGNNEKNSFVSLGYYNGETLPYDSLKIIHIPKSVYTTLVNRWKDSGLFNQTTYTDVTQYELERLLASTDPNDLVKIEYYNKLLNGESAIGDQSKDPYSVMLDKWAHKEASYYLDRLIKKYLSAGMQYILFDENFDQIKLALD